MLLSNVAPVGNMICSAATCDMSFVADDDDLESEGGRLKWARVRAGYESAADFAKVVGVNPTTYRAYENSQNGYGKLAAQFARKLGVTAEWLIEGGDEPTSEPPPKLLASTGPKTPDQPVIRTASDGDGAIEIRQVDLSYAMGPGTNIDDYADETPVQFDANFLRRVTRAEPDMLFVAQATGDSMFPTLINADEVLVDTSQRILNQQDRLWAVSVYGAGMIKRLRQIGKGRVRILSDNQTVPPEEVDTADLHIVGRVIWVGRRV